MSMEANYYLISGYDLTGMETNKFDDWKWTEDGEDFFNSQCKGNIQLFDDPANGSHLYLGYVHADNNEFDFETSKINVVDFLDKQISVAQTLEYLMQIGVIKNDNNQKYEIINFVEYI